MFSIISFVLYLTVSVLAVPGVCWVCGTSHMHQQLKDTGQQYGGC